MCGICGVINLDGKPVKKAIIRTMMDRMKHRGPDDEGMYFDGNIGLGHLRLSIIDVTLAGHQPMSDPTDRFVIVYNGEVYNYIEIREKLRNKGYVFQSNSDTEVLLYSYIEWGKKCLELFNGMFAFVIYDKEHKRIFCARDRFGIKPFYYYLDEDIFMFSSEIPGLLGTHGGNIEAENQAIFDYLIFNRTDYSEGTFFKNIRQLRHAHYLQIVQNKVRISKWYYLHEKLDMPFPGKDEYYEYLKSSIALRLRSDVPVGVCLSGGLDSSSIVSILVKDHSLYSLNTFSAVYDGGYPADESRYIRTFAPVLKNMHYTVPSAEKLIEDLDSFIRAHAEPVPTTSQYAQFKVMESAKSRVVVLLDGQGADEQLAGYTYFFGHFFKELLHQLKFAKFYDEILSYIKMHRSMLGLKAFAYLCLPEQIKTQTRVILKNILNKDYIKQYGHRSLVPSLLYQSKTLNEALVDHFEYKLEHLLKWEDRNSMWFSLEARVPFLDHRLVEKTLSLSSDKLIKNGETKFILRQAMKGILPEKIRSRIDKIGFETPENEWFRTKQFKELVYDIISSKRFKDRKIFDDDKIQKICRIHMSNKANMSQDIWKIVNLELWFEKFIDEPI